MIERFNVGVASIRVATLSLYNKLIVTDHCGVNSYSYKRIQHLHRHDNEKDCATLINLPNFRRLIF